MNILSFIQKGGSLTLRNIADHPMIALNSVWHTFVIHLIDNVALIAIIQV